MPRADPNPSDVELVQAQQKASSTLAVFKRKINSCDGQYDQHIHGGVLTPLSWARGMAWGRQHSEQDRGQAKVLLLPALDASASKPALAARATDTRAVALQSTSTSDPSVKTWDVRIGANGPITIPAQETTYLCRHFEVQNSTKKVHVTR